MSTMPTCGTRWPHTSSAPDGDQSTLLAARGRTHSRQSLGPGRLQMRSRGPSAARRQVAWASVTTEWTAPAVERADPAFVAAERRALEQWLDYHRDTLQAKCAGL